MARTSCEPGGRVLVLAEVAVPPLSATGPPKFAPSILNCTVPAGCPPPGSGETVAVNDTDWAKADDASEDVTTVVVLTGRTVWSSVSLLLAKLPLADAYCAVRSRLFPVPVGTNTHCPALTGAEQLPPFW